MPTRQITVAAAKALGWAELAAGQEGVITWTQLRAGGCTREQLRANLASKRWQAIAPDVVVTSNGPITDRQRLWVAVLAGGDGCQLAGISALRAQGLNWFGDDVVQTAVPLGRPTLTAEGFVRRQSRRVGSSTRHPARALPMMCREVALIDALESMKSQLRGCGLMAAVVQQRLFKPADLRPLVEAERTLPGRRIYLAAAGDIEGGAQSLTEIDFRGLSRKAGIRAPIGQARRKDMHRQNDIVIAGRPMLRFASVGLRLREAEAIDQLRRADARYNKR